MTLSPETVRGMQGKDIVTCEMHEPRKEGK